MFSVLLAWQSALSSRACGMYFVEFLTAVAVTYAILLILLKTGWAWKLATDIPNHRSLHTLPTPRVGGWGMIPAMTLGMALLAPQMRGAALLALGLGVVSQIDDRRGLPARVRFAAHVIAAIGAVVLWHAALPWWAMPFVVIAIIWAMNLYNFMDGADGLAGGMAFFGFLAFALAAFPALPSLASVCFVCVGAALGFLLLNFPPARLFLGDAGSVPTGFLVGAIGLYGWHAGVWDAAFPVCVFMPFWADATATLLKRVCRGERFWEAHREHYYQRMIRMQWGRRKVVAISYACMLLSSVIALSLLSVPAVYAWVAILIWLGCLALVGRYIDGRWKLFILSGASGPAASETTFPVGEKNKHG